MDVDQDEPQSLGSTRRFADTALSTGLKAVIPFETMSEIQAATLDAVLGGQDVLAQAKTGTGKTLAFLVPAVEKLRNLTPMPPNRQISILIISPTRELAAQIARECQPLLEGTSFGVQCVVGGTNINTEINKLKNNRCDVLVATPGRLKDHLLNQGLQGQLRQLRFFILDEADRLLDMGFKPDIDQILQTLPDRRSVPRQSMLFSATIPAEVMKVKNAVLLPNHAHISTLKAEDINAHLHVQQDFVIAHLHDHFAALLEIIKQDLITHGPKSKTMVFFPTARATGLGGEVLKYCLKDRVPVFELHSRIAQGARTKTAKKFSDCESGVLVTSDVSGRGVDYPNVTTVVQVGLPMTPEDYVHRLGRTARGGATGRGIIILAPFEQKFLTQGQMSSMPLKPHPPIDLDRSETDEALDQISEQSKDQTYAAWLGYYKGKMKVCGFDPVGLVRTANEYVRDGMRYQSDLTPGLLAKTVGMMGLRGVPGLRIIKPDPSEFDRRGGGNDRRGGGNARGRGSKPAGRGRA
ncbi:uncharacterized protein MELLADRAFT_37461 [Melampsora larici-populina 98AG31]|uniref:ATP-dependent RNA helicase n=1 Tax=Melampsora larici-populina (strain 98AG31 / pathotype 3-4-7) TaxID=747676 RepID=F4RT85_MELLP|nr:uncharacterized protein MELLADRAFT_37461 [Melampsora larici-populina 98AG31]EGG04477.1 hypothetical protein MELLADRAFT_37461 [Melampsora larici-populina 98AG31]